MININAAILISQLTTYLYLNLLHLSTKPMKKACKRKIHNYHVFSKEFLTFMNNQDTHYLSKQHFKFSISTELGFTQLNVRKYTERKWSLSTQNQVILCYRKSSITKNTNLRRDKMPKAENYLLLHWERTTWLSFIAVN